MPVGITIVAIIVICIVGFVIILCIKRKRENRGVKLSDTEMSIKTKMNNEDQTTEDTKLTEWHILAMW